MCFGHPSHLLPYFSWESLSGHSNRTVESRILWPDRKILDSTIHFVASAVAPGSVESRSYLFHFLVRFAYHIWNLSLKPIYTVCNIAAFICFRHLNPDCLDLGSKNKDSTIRFTPIAKWSGLFCHITCRQVKYSRLKINDNFGLGEHLLGNWKHCWASSFPIYLPGDYWTGNKFWPCYRIPYEFTKAPALLA